MRTMTELYNYYDNLTVDIPTEKPMETLAQRVGRNFLRVCKDCDLYEFIINKNKINNYKIRGISSNYCSSIDKAFQQTSTEKTCNEQNADIIISSIINPLLKRFLEENGVDPRYLNGIGQLIFNITVSQLFGKYTQPTTNISFEEFCIEQHQHHCKDILFTDFVKKFHQELQHMYKDMNQVISQQFSLDAIRKYANKIELSKN